MADVLDAFAMCHVEGDISISRVKDRWQHPSPGGWRDFMVNIVVDGYAFEVQVVLKAMLVARTALDAHKAYNQFRSFQEVFQLLGIPSSSSSLASASAESDEGADGASPARVQRMEAEMAVLKRANAAQAEKIAALEAQVAALLLKV